MFAVILTFEVVSHAYKWIVQFRRDQSLYCLQKFCSWILKYFAVDIVDLLKEELTSSLFLTRSL